MIWLDAPFPLRYCAFYFRTDSVPYCDSGGGSLLKLKLLDFITKSTLYFPGAHPFRGYIQTLKLSMPTRSVDKVKFVFFNSIYEKMTTLRKDYFYKQEWLYLLSQMLFGIRAREYTTLHLGLRQEVLWAVVTSAKHTEDRKIIFRKLSPLLEDYWKLHEECPIRLSYKAYYRSLRRSNGSFFHSYNLPHLTATHLVRHFYVQCLYYVMTQTKTVIKKHMGWKNNETIESYLDLGIWSKI